MTNDEVVGKEGQERRRFLKNIGIGGASALAAGAVLGAQPASALPKGKDENSGDTPFSTKTLFSRQVPQAQASNKFVIDLQDWALDDAGLTAVGNAMVATAIEHVRRVGKATPANLAAAIQGFGQFGQFGQFGSFGQFGQGGPAPIEELPVS